VIDSVPSVTKSSNVRLGSLEPSIKIALVKRSFSFPLFGNKGSDWTLLMRQGVGPQFAILTARIAYSYMLPVGVPNRYSCNNPIFRHPLL
jgi:hypothetical protein